MHFCNQGAYEALKNKGLGRKTPLPLNHKESKNLQRSEAEEKDNAILAAAVIKQGTAGA